jgi:hypothetical protein
MIWASSRTSPTAHLSVDQLRHFLKAGFVDVRVGYTHDAHAQFALAREQCATLARRYLEEGIDCVIDDIVLPNRWPTATQSSWVEMLGGYAHTLVVLLPSLDTVRHRNQAREDTGHPLPMPMVELCYALMESWRDETNVIILDSTHLSPTEIAAQLSQIIDGCA